MLAFLLVVLLQINQIDYSPSILVQPAAMQQKIIAQLSGIDYHPPYRVYRSLPPIARSTLIWPKVNISAQAAIVIDQMSGQALLERNTDLVLPIASLTKLMTATIFLETNPDFSQEISIEESDHSTIDGSRRYVYPGEKMTVGDLFYISLIGSGNNATNALARSTGLSTEEFLQRMNARASSLGLTHTAFNDVTGLSADNTSTVLEYSRIANYAFRHILIKEAVQRPEYTFTTLDKNIKRRIENTNQLLSDSELKLIGAKTGYIDEAGFTFVSQAEKDNHLVMVVLFNSSSSQARFSEAKALTQWAFNNFQWF